MRFGILGPLAVWRDGEPVEIGGLRVRMLLALLLLDAGRPVSPARLTDELWSDSPPSGAANALQALVSRLRAAVELAPGGYRLAVEPEAVDAPRFERLAAEGRRALTAGDPHLAAERLREGLALWRGEPLAELATGRATELMRELEALVAAHPLDERLRGLLMRSLYAAGRQADALALFAGTRRLLAEELGVDPSPELDRLHTAMLRRDPSLGGAAPPEAGAPPAQLTSFIGREEAVAQVSSLLGERRLVTLVGPGGTGKTRLAVELAARARDGVRFVELAPLGDPVAVPQAVLAAVGAREGGLIERGARATDPIARLRGALAGRRLLLVLDNCEHLVDAVARLADTLLAAGPELRVLATSREPLGVAGEYLWPVPPLDLPPPGVAAEAAPSYAAARLFVDRATAVRPDFALDERNVAAVAQICRRLDGMPLAIELAAARLRSLTVEQVAERLDDRFALLTGGSRTALPRHQTLRAVVDWSWDLLEEPERVLLRRLSVSHRMMEAMQANAWFRAYPVIGLGFVAELEGDAERAEACHRRALRALAGEPAMGAWNRTVMADAVEGLAGAAVAAGRADRAAELLGAAAALRGLFRISALQRLDTERVTAAARARLGAERFEAARRRGEAMTPEDVLGVTA